MTPTEFWWLMDASQTTRMYGNKWKYTPAQMQAQYEEMLVEHERIYGHE